jgi:putative ABC transport system permease protein
MGTLAQDLRYGLRMLARSPGLTVTAALALALGIGANTAIFSVVDAVLLRPLPYDDPDRLVMVWNRYPKMNLQRAAVSGPDFVERRDENHVFEQVAAFIDGNLNLTSAGEPERLRAVRASASLFPLLGVRPALGRTFLTEEDRPGSSQVAVVSHGLWTRRFGSDPRLVGRPLTLNGTPHTVVGILSAGDSFPDPSVDVWVPIALTAEQVDPSRRGNEYIGMIARLKSGVTLEQAQADMDLITRRALSQAPQVAKDFFESNGWGAFLSPLREEVVGGARPALLALLGAVGCVLLIACANVSNLLLARATSRKREIAIRTALGAGRTRLVRQLLTESLLLAVLGGGLGLLLAVWGVDLLAALRPENLPRVEEIGLDLRVLTFTGLLSLAAGIVFGLAPALHASRPDLNESLKEGGRASSAGPGHSRLRGLLVVSQIALALVLLVGAGLMIRSFWLLQRVDPGFRPEGLLTMNISLSTSKYPKPEQRVAFFQQLRQRLAALPGVEAVAATSLLPLAGGTSTASFFAEGQRPGPGESSPLANVRLATPDYFRTMGIPLKRGREFTDQDTRAPNVVVVDEGMVRRFWRGQDPIGRRLTFTETPTEADWMTVVGIAGEVKHSGLDGHDYAHIYGPHALTAFLVPEGMFVVVRTRSDPDGQVAAVRRAVAAMDPEQPIFAVRTMRAYVEDAVAQPRFRTALLALFAAVALVLAAVGIYGVMAYAVTQRTHEIGIRMALGAMQRDVLRMVVGQGLRLALGGVAVGVAGALALTRILSSLLFGVTATDPLTFLTVPLVLLAVSALACYLPARRATRVDPIVALRYE